MRTTFTVLSMAAALAMAVPATAQGQVSLELRGSINKSMGDFGDQSDGEAGFGADLQYGLSDNVTAYVGYDRQLFDCAQCAEEDDGIQSQAFAGGFKVHTSGDGLRPWAKAGLGAYTLDVDQAAGDAETDPSMGYHLGAGVDIPLGDVLTFSPGLRFNQFDPDFEPSDQTLLDTENIKFVTFDVGVTIHFD